MDEAELDQFLFEEEPLTPTMDFRWLENSINERTLQQMWTDAKGQIVWIDVPVVQE